MKYLFVSLAVLSLLSGAHAQRASYRKVIRMRTSVDDDIDVNDSYCESWKFTLENGDAGAWSEPPRRCLKFLKEYVTGDRYLSDSESATAAALSYAKNVTLSGDGKDCWVFDIDETLLSNLPYYNQTGYWTKDFNQTSYDEWTARGVAPALPASLSFYKEIKGLNFTVVLITGKKESAKNVTEENLQLVGYTNWDKLVFRGASEKGKKIVYKSKARQALVEEGYTIHGNMGDQWSDLLGNATAVRSFKLPNPMYYVA